MALQELIDEYMNSPIKKGDFIAVMGLGIQNKTTWGDSVTDEKVEGEQVFFDHRTIKSVHISECKKDPFFIGVNPFINKPWNSQIRMVNYNLESIIHTIGYDKRDKIFRTELFGDVQVPELNWNPIVINSANEKTYYQRGFVWSLKDKQLLIESIYNFIDIGKIIIRKRSWEYVEKRVKNGLIEDTAFKDIVDGKQRLNAILSFVAGEFPDLNGNYYNDLSNRAKNSFFNFSQISYGEIGEDATDTDVLSIFLNINFTGVQMSQDHIEFVKSIQM